MSFVFSVYDFGLLFFAPSVIIATHVPGRQYKFNAKLASRFIRLLAVRITDIVSEKIKVKNYLQKVYSVPPSQLFKWSDPI